MKGDWFLGELSALVIGVSDVKVCTFLEEVESYNHSTVVEALVKLWGGGDASEDCFSECWHLYCYCIW